MHLYYRCIYRYDASIDHIYLQMYHTYRCIYILQMRLSIDTYIDRSIDAIYRQMRYIYVFIDHYLNSLIIDASIARCISYRYIYTIDASIDTNHLQNASIECVSYRCIYIIDASIGTMHLQIASIYRCIIPIDVSIFYRCDYLQIHLQIVTKEYQYREIALVSFCDETVQRKTKRSSCISKRINVVVLEVIFEKMMVLVINCPSPVKSPLLSRGDIGDKLNTC